MKHRLQLLLGLGLLLGAFASGANAQSAASLPSDYVTLKATLGVAGGLAASVDTKQVGNSTINALSTSGSLGISFGGAAQYMFGLHRYFALGSQLGVRAWQSDAASAADRGRSVWLEAAVVPQVRIPLSPRFEAYVALPLGVTLSVLNEAEPWIDLLRASNPVLGSVADVDPRFGWTFGATLGARVALTDRFGVLVEVGYSRHSVLHSVDVHFTEERNGQREETSDGTAIGLSLVTQELAISAGVFF